MTELEAVICRVAGGREDMFSELRGDRDSRRGCFGTAPKPPNKCGRKSSRNAAR